ncbi:MAG: aspartate-semialdehyde dehydrogenase [Oligoflexales bacterium]
MKKKRVALVGATGVAGQQFLEALENHPWFELTAIAGSQRSAGKPYIDAIKTENGHCQWYGAKDLPPIYARMPVVTADEIDVNGVDIVFTAVDSDTAKEIEPKFAKYKPTISTASAFRMAEDVPLLIPGVNSNHHALIRHQQEIRNWKGFIVPIPNCTTYGLACSLAPIQQKFGIDLVAMTSMQAVSGAGRGGGVLSLDMLDNIIPFISGEEEKVEQEVKKIFGTLQGTGVKPADVKITATCTRVPVVDGHTEAVFVKTKSPCTVSAVKACFEEYDPKLQGLPTAEKNFFRIYDDPYHPQPRLDRDKDGGMSTHIGRLREDKALGGVKYVLLSHNTKAGAAKGAILIAEYLCKEGFIP